MAKDKAGMTPAPRKTTPKKPATPEKKVAGKAAPARKRANSPTKPSHPLMRNGHDWDRDAVVNIVCNALAASSKAVGTILAEGHEGNTLPDYATFARWLAEKPEDGATNPYCDIYARAKEAQADFMAEELAELHNKAWVPAYDMEGNPLMNASGVPLMTVDKASAAIVRLEADNKKWLMGKLKPRKYGDKVQTELTGPGGGAIAVQSTVTFVQPPQRDEED